MVPATHSVHTLLPSAAEKVPSWHKVQLTEPGRDANPDSQTVHKDVFWSANVPDAHSTHTLAPVAFVTEPDAHAVQ